MRKKRNDSAEKKNDSAEEKQKRSRSTPRAAALAKQGKITTQADKLLARLKRWGSEASEAVEACEGACANLVDLRIALQALPDDFAPRRSTTLRVGDQVSLRPKYIEQYGSLGMKGLFKITQLAEKIVKCEDDEGGALTFPVSHLQHVA